MCGFPLMNLEILLANGKEMLLLWQEKEGTRKLICTIGTVIHTRTTTVSTYQLLRFRDILYGSRSVDPYL
jgi:hypothetical protein